MANANSVSIYIGLFSPVQQINVDSVPMSWL